MLQMYYFRVSLEGIDRKFRIIYKSRVNREGHERDHGAMGPCESMRKNDQYWRKLNSQSLKSCSCGQSPRKLMKERSTDNSCCFDRSLPPHYWPDSYNQKKRILLPRKRVSARVNHPSKTLLILGEDQSNTKQKKPDKKQLSQEL